VAGLEGGGSRFKCRERERKKAFRREINADGPNLERERDRRVFSRVFWFVASFSYPKGKNIYIVF